jgi:hypothetical protein
MATKSKAKRELAINPKIWTLWQQYSNVSAESLSQSVEKKYAALSEAVCAQIAADAACFSRLGDSDEAIFSHLASLMDVYRRVVELAGETSLESPTVRALVMGIFEVLNSRLREFEDEFDGVERNPITTEKKLIFDEAFANAKKLIENKKVNFTTGLREDHQHEWDEHFDIILQGDFYEMYSYYREGLRFCQTKLDDLHGRKTARFFTELIEREGEELGNIINVQVRALEDAAAKDFTIAAIIDALREAHQQTEPVISKLQGLLNAPQKKPLPCRTFEEFESGLLSALEKSAPTSPEQKNFFAALDAETMALLDVIDMDYKKAAYKLQRIISAEVLLAGEIMRVFEKVSIPKIPDDTDPYEQEIIAGIRETIDIKISGLQESIQEFMKKSSDILKDFSAKKNLPNGENRAAVLADVRAAWLENPPDEDGIDEFFENIRDGESFSRCREHADKQVHLYLEILEKSSVRFKKETLLYEICTYEEILTHSVSRLRNSSNPAVLSAALTLDDTFRALEIILKKNNVEIIRPSVREQFNAKEHEVLVAEKNEDFAKGEIIKIMTAGYKFKNHVILRANVIAAR